MASARYAPTVEMLGKLGTFDFMTGTEPDDLSAPWPGRVLLLTGYGPHTRQFMTKMVNHHHGTAILSAGVETVLFHRYVFGHATAALFVEGRMSLAPDAAPVPVALVAYGEDDALVLRRADIKGHFIWMDSAKRTGGRTLA